LHAALIDNCAERDAGGCDIREKNKNTIQISSIKNHYDNGRRTALVAILSSVGLTTSTVNPAAASEEEFGRPMNDLTRQIRTSVVRGAQLIDKVDGRWERFSDDLGLGAERNQPKRNVIDAGGNQISKKVVKSDVIIDGNDLVLDEKFAEELLQECDEAFLSCLKSQKSTTAITKRELDQQIEETKRLVRKSFFATSLTPTVLEEFNFECYTHFKSFNEILVKQEVKFPIFKKDFEALIGNRLFQLAMQQKPSLRPASSAAPNLTTNLQNALQITDDIGNFLQKKGLITSWERSIPPNEDIEDFTSTAEQSKENFFVSSDLPYSLALNGDVTLGSQLLLQELGYRLYPSFGRWIIQKGVMQCFDETMEKNKVAIQMDDYYMDTSYSSNPDLFEVKQVLLNIVIQRE